MVKPEAFWNNETTKITESNPDVSSKTLLHIDVNQADLKTTTEALEKFLEEADEIYEKIGKKITNDNTIGNGNGNGNGGGGSSSSGGSTGGSTDNTNPDVASFDGDTVKDFLTASKAIQKVASFIINELGHSMHNSKIDEHYSKIIKKSLSNILDAFDVPNEERGTALQKLNEEYHKRISFYSGSAAVS